MPKEYPWTSTDKARWLAELARAIDEAQQIVWRLSILRGDDPRTSEIYGRLESARDEVVRLQRGNDREACLELNCQWQQLLANVAACASTAD